ncbi:MAG: PAS domain S-box protein, partial [Haloferacaceae archaeon]
LMTDAAATAQTARDELYEIVRNEEPFEQRAREALALGERYLDVDNGHLTRIDRATDHWEVIVSTDAADGRFSAGLELDLGTTYCRRTIAADSQIDLFDAPEQGWADDPAFETHGLHCYHGTPVVVDREPYGTVCFVDDDPREPFGDDETMFGELVAQLLGRELERRRHGTRLTRQTNLAVVLNRILRHNLRNDLCVVRGYSQLLVDRVDDPQYDDVVLDTVDDLIDLTEKARQLDRIVAVDSERERTRVTELVEDVVQTLSERYPTASISAEYDDHVTASVLPNFVRALTELIENAAKHGGETPTVTVSVEAVPNAVEVRIADDGPGLGDHEAAVLQTGAETPLTHGSGLGLWLSNWIVTSHDGSIDAAVSDDGTTMTVTVPRNPNSNAEREVVDLRRPDDQYRAAFEEANDAMVIVDDEARIVDANPEASGIYGLERRALLGQPFRRFLPDDFEFERAWREFKHAERDRDTVTIVDADGLERQVEYSATTDVVPGQHLVVSRDVSERVERKGALEETTQRLRAVIQASPDVIVALDSDGTVRLWNEAAADVFGYGADAAVGESIRALDLYGEGERPASERPFERALAGETLTDHEIRRRTTDGERVHLRLSTAPIEDESGAVTGVVGIAKDLTAAAEPPFED